MKKWMVCLLGPSLLGLVPLAARVPVILSQLSTIKVCEGDSVSLEVIVQGSCDAQWFAALNNGNGYYDLKELPGENSFRLTIDPVIRSNIPLNQYFLLRLANQTDTIWSKGIELFIMWVGKPLEDTLLVNHFPYIAELYKGALIMNTNLVWSTGDTSILNGIFNTKTFTHSGKYWVKTYQPDCSRTDTFDVLECPHVIHLNDTTPVPSCWCADTIFIERNISPGVITVKPGTTIKFTGDYSLSSAYMDIRGTDNDSIYIIGHNISGTNQVQGRLYSQDLSPTGQFAPSQFKNLIIKHMDYVHIFRAGGPRFYRNNHIYFYDAHGAVFHQNKLVEISYQAKFCTFLENDSVMGLPTPFPRGGISYFFCENNAFYSNKSGLIIKKDNTSSMIGPVRVFNCTFNNNHSTALTTKALINYIDQNIFSGNVCDSGTSVLQCNFREVIRNHFTYSHDLYFRNNTLYGNSGRQDMRIDIPDASPAGGTISNNIFWNANNPNGKTIVSDSFKNHLSIDHNSFRSDSTGVNIPIDTSISFQNNYFERYPDFADTLKADFSLKETSFLIDKGSDIEHGPVGHDLFFAKDFAGFSRKTGEATDPGAFEFHGSSPMSFQYVTPDTLVCQGDTFSLKAIPSGKEIRSSYVYKWFFNGRLVSRADSAKLLLGPGGLNIPGIYEAEISNGHDTMWTGPIVVTYAQKPAFDIQPASHLICRGDDIRLEIRFPQDPTMHYNWTSVRHGNILPSSPIPYLKQVTESDTLYVTASNDCGTAVSDPILLFVAPLPAPSLGADTTLHAGDSLLLDAGEGVRYVWRSGETGAQIYGHPNDTTWVTVTNAYGCTGSDTLVISMIPTGLDESGARGLEFLLYPNPARDRVFIRIPEGLPLPGKIRICSAEGRVIMDLPVTQTGQFEINISHLPPGTYIFRLSGSVESINHTLYVSLIHQ